MLTPETLKLAAISSIFLLVVSIGLQARVGSTLRVFSDPKDRRKALGGLFAMFVAVPLLAYIVVRIGGPGQTTGAALLALSLAPMAPFLPRKQWKAGGDPEWVIALQVAATLLSILLAPIYLAILSRAFGMEIASPVAGMMKVLGLTVFLPLLIGLGVQQVSAGLAARLAGPLGLVGTAILAGVALVILVALWPAVSAAAATPALPASILIALGGVLAGHFLVGGAPSDRTSAAMAAVSRHPGAAFVIAGAALGEVRPDLLANVLLFVLVSTLVVAVYQQMNRQDA